ncbi:MAG: hypothetical protein R3D46_13615 [Defluviimonas denitrificans]
MLRAALSGGAGDVEIVAVNDIAKPEMAAYLFEYDRPLAPGRGQSRWRTARWSSTGRAFV